jgi:hypothetical protein
VRRRKLQPAAWLARLITVGALGAIVVLGLGIPGERGRYGRAVRDQRNDVTRLPAATGPSARAGERLLCARGVTGFASAAAAAYGQGLRDADGVIVPTALAAVSDAAIEADRWAEQGGFDGATPGPALPQRVGLDGTGATVAPPQAACEGAQAFAQARISGRGLPSGPAATTGPSTAKTKKVKKSTKKPAKKPTKPATTRTRTR